MRASDQSEWWGVSDEGVVLKGCGGVGWCGGGEELRVCRPYGFETRNKGQNWPIPHRSKGTCLTWALNFLHTVVIILKELSFYFWDLRKSGKLNFFAPNEHISKSVLIIWTQYCVPKINNVLNFLKLKIISFLQNGQNVVRSLISCFAEIAKFSPKFRFRLLQISRNSR